MPLEAKARTAIVICLLALSLPGLPAGIPGAAAGALPMAPLYDGPDLGPHRIRLLLGGTELEFSGSMSAGTASELRQVLDANPGVGVVHLNSPGGLVDEGRVMFSILREHQLITTTDRYCLSACALAFLGGRERYLAPGARLGFHAESSDAIDAAHLAARQQIDKDQMLSLGIPQAFVDKAFSTPKDQIWLPTVGELEEANVINGVSADYVVALQAGTAPSGAAPAVRADSSGNAVYHAPSVEETPGGVTIYRGSGAN
jgi:hypothetical protein